ncbi:type II toxin-antitoxin system ParD family antitoxin [Agrobacterium vitis]|uniref:Type II toxin-antitoxin system ParD family antitoxin n=1 Tax=Agrobacterium vitis TaxID=373 RepID=A0ABD6G6M9_AGRVI|nr:type II toxin-antitoxin system ParD family antitoxin [Agrobacterium vitis]MUO77841.1 type II toxin-antitoxin system ParD family antitoxin [Agrobacterium vitis]MUO93359.1 type II toxin-antitoxin system ParD family antitoxin [Agrobacterium vitis]MUP04710.1 type II toxin-antitoxin system ParD family antitoxin [Agrobacterium vitis]MUZ80853.1 type II toxin-antitoxin system ParD family antitoxin [Agrobacterium vitis]MVA08962.1 type II toxin-antitoxin system ParD family antitoxin [Agrobacterium vi
MATTSLTLGPHWEGFIKQQINSGRYASASEVVRDALRELEEREEKLKILRHQIDMGWQQADRGEFAEDWSLKSLNEKLDREQ